jgi:hypothetical protein
MAKHNLAKQELDTLQKSNLAKIAEMEKHQNTTNRFRQKVPKRSLLLMDLV